MNRSIAILIVVTLCCLLVAGHALAQVFAQPAPAGAPPGAAPPAAATPAAAPVPVAPGAAHPGAPPTPRPPVGAPQAGGFIRAGGPGGGGGIVYQSGPDWGGQMGGFGFRPSADDPEMAKLMQSEHELEQESNALVRQFGETEDYGQREKLRTQMRELLSKQFDIQRQRRERELASIEERISKLREQLKKRNSARDTIIDRRLESLTSDAEGLGWTPPATGGPQGFSGGIISGPRPRPAVAR